eukprot:1813318-Rhodomonas_salina.1
MITQDISCLSTRFPLSLPLKLSLSTSPHPAMWRMLALAKAYPALSYHAVVRDATRFLSSLQILFPAKCYAVLSCNACHYESSVLYAR